jgi:hypothetical protein
VWLLLRDFWTWCTSGELGLESMRAAAAAAVAYGSSVGSNGRDDEHEYECNDDLQCKWLGVTSGMQSGTLTCHRRGQDQSQCVRRRDCSHQLSSNVRRNLNYMNPGHAKQFSVKLVLNLVAQLPTHELPRVLHTSGHPSVAVERLSIGDLKSCHQGISPWPLCTWAKVNAPMARPLQP